MRDYKDMKNPTRLYRTTRLSLKGAIHASSHPYRTECFRPMTADDDGRAVEMTGIEFMTHRVELDPKQSANRTDRVTCATCRRRVLAAS